MILKQTILAGLAMLLLSIPLRSEVTTTIIDDAIAVSTNQSGVEGYKGCTTDQLKKMSAYVFELQIKNPSKHGVCSARNAGKWSTYAKQTSIDNAVVFEQLPKGQYRILVYSGAAIGCVIDEVPAGFPARSIVYGKETSSSIEIGDTHSSLIGQSPNIPQANDGLSVFPNPTTGQLTVQLKNHALKLNGQIVFYDLLGRPIQQFSKPIESKANIEWQFNLSTYPPGTYLIRIFDNLGNSYQQKILIQGL